MTIVLNRQKAVEYAQKYWDEESGNYNGSVTTNG